MRKNAGRFLVPFFATASAIAFIGQIHWRPAPFALLAEIRTDAPARLELHYNRGYGMRQEGVSTKLLEPASDFVRTRFLIEANTAQNLRLINFGNGQSLQLRSLTLKPLFGAERRLTLNEVISVTPGTSMSENTDYIQVQSTGTEPLVLHLDGESRHTASGAARLMQWPFVIAMCLTAIGLVIFLRPAPSLGNTEPHLTSGLNHPARLRFVIIGSLILTYIGASLLNLNGSSTAVWREYADQKLPDAGVILGQPQSVRSDEWMLQTPWIFSQSQRDPPFSSSNPNIGSDVTPLLTNLPVRHWSTIFRPQMWPFFLFETERAFAFYWNLKTFSLLLGAILFFGLLTNKRTFLDLAGAVFLTFSPFVQWWLSTPACLPEMLAMFFFGMWLGVIIYRGRTWWQIAASAVCLVVAIENFIFCCYPRFQVPLIYFAATLLVGGLIVSKRASEFRTLRFTCIGFVIGSVFLLTWLWWRDVAEILRVTSNLSYPGQIRYHGGDFAWTRLLGPSLEFSMTSDRYPETLANACEASGFFFIAPLLALPVVRDLIRGRVDWLLLVPLIVIGFVLVYMLVGVPIWVANLSGWALVYSGRANLLLGVASVVLLVRYLTRGNSEASTFLTRFLILVGSLILLIPILKVTNVRLGHFETSSTIAGAALLIGLVTVCLWVRSVAASCILLLVPQFYACALINPVSRGLPGITRSDLLHWVSDVHERTPDGKWLVLGTTVRALVLPDFIKACGADVLGGTRCNPDYSMLQILDPTQKYRQVYDRYAWIHFQRGDVASPVFVAGSGLTYEITIPLSETLLDDLQVTHVLEVDAPPDQEIPSGFHPVGTFKQCRLLERN